MQKYRFRLGESRRLVIQNSGRRIGPAGQRNDDQAGISRIALRLRGNREERAEVLAIALLKHCANRGNLPELGVHVTEDRGHRRLR